MNNSQEKLQRARVLDKMILRKRLPAVGGTLNHNNSFHFLIAYAVPSIQIGNYMDAFLLLTSRQGAH